jgi:hypothetical protein
MFRRQAKESDKARVAVPMRGGGREGVQEKGWIRRALAGKVGGEGSACFGGSSG